MTKDYISIGKASDLTGFSKEQLRLLHKRKELVPAYISSGGTRYYSRTQLEQFMGVSNQKDRAVIGYCRVSSRKQEPDLKRQIERVELYLTSQGRPFEIIQDIGSGINYQKKGLQNLLQRVENGEIEKIVVLYKDRLLRFGYELFEIICRLHGTTIEVIDQTQKTDEEEIVEDLVQIITVFSAKLQGKRAKKTRTLLQELTDD